MIKYNRNTPPTAYHVRLYANRFAILCAVVWSLLLASPVVAAWASFQFDLPSGAKESLWRDALAEHVGGRVEVSMKEGRADVVTETEVYEVDFQNKWKEGMGQVKVYAQSLGVKPVLALISYGQGPERIQKKSKELFAVVDEHCKTNGVRMLILFPSGPEKAHQAEISKRSQTYTNSLHSQFAEDGKRYWISSGGIRHKPGCHWFNNTNSGGFGNKDEGRPCKVCGG